MAQQQLVLVVNADATNITITERLRATTTININGPDGLLTSFKMLCDAARNNNNLLAQNLYDLIKDLTFEQLNASINKADSIKDGTPAGNGLLSELFPDANWSLADLKNIIGGVKDHCIANNMIQRFTFTRTKANGSDNSRNWGLDTSKFRIGYDAGLGLDTLFPSPTYDYTKILIETFGKYIDPSTGGRDANMPFPNKGTKLVLNGGLFNAFGYLGAAMCRLQATNTGQDQYKYQMFLANKQIPENTGINRAGDANIRNFFGGNAEKSRLLNNSPSADLKKQVIVGKGLGDKLQVIILWIRSQLLEGNTGIATCDEVVALLCIILQLPFFLTSTSRDRDNVKIDEVLFYNPGGQNVGVALERYNQEYAIVLDSYRDMIGLIGLLLSTNPKGAIPVIASGGGMDVLQIPDRFYNAIISDLRQIHDWIQATYDSNNFLEDRTPRQIYGEMSHLKKLTARQIFKLNKTRSICQFVRTAKTYTCDDRILHYPFDKPHLQKDLQEDLQEDLQNNDISKRAFYDLFKNIPQNGGGNGLSTEMTTGATEGSAGSGKPGGGPPSFFPEVPPVPEMRDADPFYNAVVTQDSESEFVYIDPILADIKPGDPIPDKTGTGTDVRELKEKTARPDDKLAEGKPVKAQRADSGAKAVTETESGDGNNSLLNNCSPIGVFDANAALRIELFNLYNKGNWTNTTITFWEVLNECMEVFVYDPRYDTERLNELITNFNAGSLYVYVPGPGGPTGSGGPSGPGGPTDPSEQPPTPQFTMSDLPCRLGEMREPYDVARILAEWDKLKRGMEVPAAVVTMNVAKEHEAAIQKAAAGSGSPERISAEAAGSGSPPQGVAVVGDTATPMGLVSSVSSAPMVTVERLPTDAGQWSPAVTARTEILPSDLLDAEDSQGGSRRSTRRRKYRKTLKTTRRKKTGKQSSRTRLTKRRRNKKRRSTTRKN